MKKKNIFIHFLLTKIVSVYHIKCYLQNKPSTIRPTYLGLVLFKFIEIRVIRNTLVL